MVYFKYAQQMCYTSEKLAKYTHLIQVTRKPKITKESTLLTLHNIVYILLTSCAACHSFLAKHQTAWFEQNICYPDS